MTGDPARVAHAGIDRKMEKYDTFRYAGARRSCNADEQENGQDMKRSQDIRNDFLEFFRSKGHTVVPSASLLPVGDKTLLFTNAGMNQFKDIFLGQGRREYTRAADTQKCMRVSGKHNDLDDVGRDTYHHTFFEMLGNWSFGDYYKKEAIGWAWELLTSVWKLHKDKLYATVYREDGEAYELWKSETDIAHDHIMYFGEKDNFWEMGETGPCGPCSEIHIDQGEGTCNMQHVAGHVCGVNAGCSRYIELWNLVFIQYNRQTDGSLEPLPSKHVDTGMGFERVTAVLQGEKSNYDSDIFRPLLETIGSMTGRSYGKSTSIEDIAMRVIADHIRSLSFSIADGIMPSNDGRGYVIRRILRRALRFGQKLGLEKPFLAQLVPILEQTMGGIFPELGRNSSRIVEVLEHEETRYFTTLDAGMRELESMLQAAKKDGSLLLAGDKIFHLYDSLGFPADIAEEVAKDEGIQADMEGFAALMEEQKNRGRQSWKGAHAEALTSIPRALAPTDYRGDREFESRTSVLFLATDEAAVTRLDAGTEGWLIADATPFYAEGGGQIADTGTLTGGSGTALVLDVTRRDAIYLHRVRVESGCLSVGDGITLVVEEERKRAIARNHTATHLLQQALVEVLGDHVAQAGSHVSAERLRFDFSHFRAIEESDLVRVEEIVNRIVRQNIDVSKEIMDRETAVSRGAKAFFGEKYGETVRVVTVGGFSMELCGGTHVDRTGDIGAIRILSETSVSSGVRRIEAVTGQAALRKGQEDARTIALLSSMLNVPTEKLVERIESLVEQGRKAEKELVRLRTALAVQSLESAAAQSGEIGGVRVIVGRIDDAEVRVLKESVDGIRNRYKDAVVLVGSRQAEGKCMLILGAAGKALELGFDAKAVIGEIATLVDGSGGGRKDMAQAGGKDAAGLDAALQEGRRILEERLQ